MEKHHSCLNTRAIIQYFQEHYPEEVPRLLEGLGPEIDSLPNPLEFLLETHNWVSSRVVIQLFANARAISHNDHIAFEIGFQSAARKKLGYVQRILMFAHRNPRRTLRRVQAINDKFNRNKAVELVETTRDRAVVRLRWFRHIPGTIDFCLFNQGIYSGIPTIWNLPPAQVVETRCFFQGDDCCEYHCTWQRKSLLQGSLLQWLLPWSLLRSTITELEQDKELLKGKFHEIHQLNLQLKEKIDQLLCLQQAGVAALSFPDLENLLEVSLGLLIKFTKLDRACVFLAAEGQRTASLKGAVGFEPGLASRLADLRFPLGETRNIVARVAVSGKPLVFSQPEASVDSGDSLFKVLQPGACVVAPLEGRGDTMGVVLADRTREQGAVTEADKEFVVSFANQLAIALENAVLYRKLEASERQHRGLVENAHEGIWIIGEDGVVKFANPRMRRIVGEESLEGRRFQEFWDPNNLETLDRILARNREGQLVQEELELFLPRRGAVVVSMNSVPLMENGRFQGAFAMFNDVTEKKKMEKQLLQHQKMEAIGTLAGGIAHNFNNILMNIMGLTGLILAGTEADDPRHDDLKEIEQEIFKGSTLTKQLLSFGQSSRFSPRPLDLNLLLDKISRLFARTRSEITISKSLAPDLPAVEADQGQMEQAILNLLVNAWQAMAGRGELALTTEAVVLPRGFCQRFGRPAGPYLHLAVADSGSGMDEATAARIFEPFFSTKEPGQGTGLGLSTVYAIIKNHRGFIKVDSQKGMGTTFHLYLPTSGKAAVPEKAVRQDCHRGTGTILLVDDEDRIRSVGKRILERLGYEILLAENGFRALKIYYAHQARIDLVILDMIMPGMGGRETYQKIKEVNPRVKVLLSSGYSIDGEAQETLAAGAQGFIQKPYRIEALSRKIGELLAGTAEPG